MLHIFSIEVRQSRDSNLLAHTFPHKLKFMFIQPNSIITEVTKTFVFIENFSIGIIVVGSSSSTNMRSVIIFQSFFNWTKLGEHTP